MKKKSILLPLIGLLVYVLVSSYSSGPGGSVGDRTGASGSGSTGCSTGSGCHAASATSSTNVTVQLMDGSTPVTSYVASHAYTIKITGTQTSSSLTLAKFGFQVCIVGTGSTTSIGTLSNTGISSVAHVGTYSGVSIVEHSTAISGSPYVSGSGGSGTTYTISVPWTSPATGGGCATIFCVLNAVDGGGGADVGDKWNTATLAVAGPVAPITGTLSMCTGNTTTLSDATTGGTWTTTAGTGSVSLAPSGSSVVVTGSSAGTANVTYTNSCGGFAVATVTVNAPPSSIFVSTPSGGTANVCVGSSGLTLSSLTPGGTWSSLSTGIATINSSGVVTGAAAGTAIINYTISSTGCVASTTVTVNPNPTITGTASLCQGGTTTLTPSVTGGTWSSGSTGTATVGASSGIVSGVSPGTAVMTYVAPTGCSATRTVTVNALPVISGTLSVCVGATTALGGSPSGGSWGSGSTGVATVSPSGIVSGVSAGTAVITYTASTGCFTTSTVTVNPGLGPISGTAAICVGSTTTLVQSTPGGTWTSSATGVASIGATTSTTAVVNGVTTGTANITYTAPITGCFTTLPVTVNPLPTGISGTLVACVGSGTTLTGVPAGGTWSPATTAVTSVDASGNVTGLSAGTQTITYSLGAGCFITAGYTVNPTPSVTPTTGALTVCTGENTTLVNTTPGGTWSVTGGTGLAIIGSSTGVVTGVTAGTINTTYLVTNGFGCSGFATYAMTVNPIPTVGSGSPSAICNGSSVTLSPTGGTTYVWSPASGLSCTACTNPVASPTATTTYTVTGTTGGCSNTGSVTITVNPLPDPITGTAALCIGSVATLSSGTAGGTWTSSNAGLASIGSATGDVTGVAAGAPTISYALPTGCRVTRSMTVNAPPAAISGASQVCVGAAVTNVDVTSGGTWSSSSPGTASVSPSVGSTTFITGVSAGTATITYNVTATGCFATKNLTVNAVPSVSAGSNTAICSGSSTVLGATGATTYTWAPGVGLSCTTCSGPTANPGTTVTYTLTGSFSTGCSATSTITVSVNPLPSAITGVMSMCEGSSVTLGSPTAGGTWESDNVAIATVGSSTGVVTGVSAGTATISYVMPTGCMRTAVVTVNALPASIGGTLSVCEGLTGTLTNSVAGGTWTSSNTLQATVGASSGDITGVAAGSPTITYTLPGGCFVTAVATVNPLSNIVGSGSLCLGTTTPLTNATAGGTWTSSNPAVATVGGSSGIVNGLTVGSATITYTLPSGCMATHNVNVVSAPGPIGGSLQVCLGGTTNLIEAGAGVWTSFNPSIAAVDPSTGVVTGVTVGIVQIFYSLGTGCGVSAFVTVNPLPTSIVGASSLCVGSTTLMIDATPGGVWSSTGAATIGTAGSATGIVTGVSAGVANITYTATTGCIATKVITVNPLPLAITGASSVCEFATTVLSDGTAGGVWFSSPTTTATVNPTSGIVTGVGAGVATVSYALLGTGCQVTTTITVNPTPVPITGTPGMCEGATTILADATAGGTWTSSNPSVATIGSSSGVVSGVAAGFAIMTYSMPTGCYRTLATGVYVIPSVSAITGASSVCTGTNITLASTTPGGTWSSSSTANATVDPSTGVVSGVASGSATITYTVSSGAGCSSFATSTITVNESPLPVAGTLAVCLGLTTTVSDPIPGGTWSTTSGIATVGSSTGVVTGVTAGTTTVVYTVSSGCTASALITVNPLPAAISGTPAACIAGTTTLTDAGGGTWSSSDLSVATAGLSTGIISGVTAGSATITYTLPTGCIATVPFTVSAFPSAGAITGSANVCVGDTIMLSDVITGGVWSSSTTATATVGSTGIVTGVLSGSTVISYSVTNVCGTAVATQSVAVNALPDAGNITGSSVVCIGGIGLLSSSATGGAWSTSSAATASVGSTGIVTGVAAGLVTISYTVTNICGTDFATAVDTVIGLPAVGSITGKDSVCQGDTIHLADAVPGGAWSAFNGNAAVGPYTGIVTGVWPGVDTIYYTVFNVCGSTSAKRAMRVKSYSSCNVGVNPAPAMAEGIKLYPNPSNGTFSIELAENSNGATITIVDVLGKTIETRVAAANQHTVIMSLNVAPGSYIVKINAGGQIYRQKIVIE